MHALSAGREALSAYSVTQVTAKLTYLSAGRAALSA